MSNLKIYVKSILITVILGGLVGFIISGYIDYSSLQKPPLAPPSSLFPIVWTILYILMGISYGLLKSKKLIYGEKCYYIVDSKINLIYYSQLIVNLLWPIAFFVLKWRFFAFLWIILLVVLVINMIIQFYNKNQLSGLLQIPYLLWLLFATYLNLGVYLLNR